MATVDRRSVKTAARRLAGRVGLDIRRVSKAPKATPPDPSPDFYTPSASCQIPWLGVLYELYFGCRTDGTFVEVGAFDGDSYSNTSCLADLGWRGHYIEPVGSSADLCRQRHAANAQIQVHELAIGAEVAEITIQVGGPLSTTDTKTYDEYQHINWAKFEFVEPVTVQVAQITLNQFLEQHTLSPSFDLLVVDVEGYEQSVFAGFDLEAWHPTMLIVEIADTHPDLTSSRNAHAALSREICEAGYIIVFKDVINTVYLQTDHWETTYSDDG